MPVNCEQSIKVEKQSSSAAQIAIAQMRERLGSSSVARRYNQLNRQQKSMVLFGARLKPATFINYSFEQFDIEQREGLRAAIITMFDVSKSFGSLAMTRDQFRQNSAANDVNSEENERVTSELDDVTQATAELISQFETTALHTQTAGRAKKVQ
ncbi:hypothetical protein [Shewanella surugensis]|uniref:Uncharacterized protein n=1 Tax=Shewanella surugensis TaxID=212020 RepID=A0ABT0L6L6_9GAMM|nr:hypothetical protein [Shewanella surugensis]MCL1123332.1 hypothetical protein [Shewanella surugensis]